MARASALVLLVASTASPAVAEDFCVSTALELQNALTQAQGNAQNNTIRIETGIYHTADNGNLDQGFNYANSMPGSLTITGGWKPNCAPSRPGSSAFETVLDGGNVHRVLAIAAGDDNANIAIANLTIQSGLAPLLGNEGGGLLITGFQSNAETGTVSIDRVVFTDNQANYRSALAIESHGRVEVTNSLFHDNIANISGMVQISRLNDNIQATYFINNTLVNNTIENSGNIVSLRKSGPGGNVAANNILWNNVALWDISFSGNSANQHLLYNTVQNVIGNAGVDVGNSSADPLLEFDFSLNPESPAIDAGFEPAPGLPNPPPELDWELGDLDVLAFQRVAGAAVDMGAFETLDVMFKDSFE